MAEGPAAAAPTRRGRIVVVLFALALLLAGGLAVRSNLLQRAAQDAAGAAAAAEGLEELAIGAAPPERRRHVFRVEVMRDDAARQRGLMFRQHLPADRGMLFDFERTAPIAMWMKNTLIPLDMLFIRADGSVARIEERTEPLSERTIPSGEPVRAVLELDGGTAARLGLRAGDRVDHPLFKRR